MSLQSVSHDFEELDQVLGIKELIGFRPLADLHARRDYVNLCGAIGSYMGLPNTVRLSTTSDSHRFTTHALSKTDASGRGTHGIAAQVHIPSHLPMYGTAAFSAYVIEMLLAEGFTASNPYTAVTLLAHELSHVLLHSIKHPNRTSEQFTDLVPIVLGFGDIVELGRVVTSSTRRGDREYTSTMTYGYLTNAEFAVARKLARGRLANRTARRRAVLSLAKRVGGRSKEGIESVRTISQILRELDLAKPRVRGCDGARVVELHLPGYLDEQGRLLNNVKRVSEDALAFCLSLTHFSIAQRERLEGLHSDCRRSDAQLAIIEKRLRSDLRVVLRTRNLGARLHQIAKDTILFFRRVATKPWRADV